MGGEARRLPVASWLLACWHGSWQHKRQWLADASSEHALLRHYDLVATRLCPGPTTAARNGILDGLCAEEKGVGGH